MGYFPAPMLLYLCAFVRKSYVSYVRLEWMRCCRFVRAVLVWTETLTWTHTRGLCTADKIRSYPYTHTHTYNTVRPHSGTNTLVAQQREHIEPWTRQVRLAFSLANFCDPNMLVWCQRGWTDQWYWCVFEEVAPGQGLVWLVNTQEQWQLCAHCFNGVDGATGPPCLLKLIETLSDRLGKKLFGVV